MQDRICLTCRRAGPNYKPQWTPHPRWRLLTCKCGAQFHTRIHNKIYCTQECRASFFPLRHFPLKTPEQRRGRYGSRYRRLRVQVIAEEDFCWICGFWVDKARAWPDPLMPSLDHVVALSLGGEPYARDNCRLAHLRCNRLRANQLR